MPGTQISPNFRLEEFLSHGPPVKDLEPRIRANIERLILSVLQPVRDLTGLAIIVSSGYRPEEVNTRVGGSKTSDHLTGDAADIYAAASHAGSWKKNTRHLYQVLHDHFMGHIGQLILEDRRSEGATRFWIHVSNPTRRHKGEALYSPVAGSYVTFDPASHARDLA